MRGTGKIIGDVISPEWDEPCDAELGIAYHGENGPVYWIDNELKETDEQ